MDSEESFRIHLDWWGECRTCKHWQGKREPTGTGAGNGLCMAEKSVLFKQETTRCGHCPEWDSFDVETALKVLEPDET